MLDWLKTILGEAYSEEIDKKVSEEIGKNFVARADFNTLNTEKKALADTVKERDKQLETLKASTGDVEALKTQIATLQTENTAATKAHEAEIKRLKIDTAVELALSAAKAKNVKAVKALLDLIRLSSTRTAPSRVWRTRLRSWPRHPTVALCSTLRNQRMTLRASSPARAETRRLPAIKSRKL